MPAGSLGNEFRILDPVGADGGNTDPCLQQLDPKAAAVGIEQGLGSRVAVKERNGLKTGDRADFEDSASGPHVGNDGSGDADRGLVIGIDHPAFLLPPDL